MIMESHKKRERGPSTDRISDIDKGTVAVSRPVRTQLGTFTLFALAFNICNSWTSVAGTLQLALFEGGYPALVYGIIASAIVFFCIGASLAELSSVYPTAGGQYHYTSILAPARWGRGWSYTIGLVTVFSWVATVASIAMIPSQFIAALAKLHHPEYAPTRWQITLVNEGLLVIALLVVLFLLKRFSWLHLIGVAETMSLFLVNLICYLARSDEKASNEDVWIKYYNQTGWPDGVSFLTGVSTVCFMFCGLDAATHMAEECVEPKRKVPQTIMVTISVGFVAGFSYAMSLVYALPDPQSVLTSPAYLPLNVQVVGFKSVSMATGISIAMVVMAMSIMAAAMETASRLTWSFARDEGFIGSGTLKIVNPVLQVPVSATIAAWALIALCGFLYTASETAFNALVGSAVTFQQISYMVPIALLLYRRRSSEFLPPDRAFRLPGFLGWLVNILALIFTVAITIFSSFPPSVPATSDSMNYTCVVLAIAVLLGAVNWWFYARKHYQGPTLSFADQDVKA